LQSYLYTKQSYAINTYYVPDLWSIPVIYYIYLMLMIRVSSFYAVKLYALHHTTINLTIHYPQCSHLDYYSANIQKWNITSI